MSNASTARSRELGAQLQLYRIKNHWDLEQLADRLGWSRHKLVHAELGERELSEVDTTVLLTECGATHVERSAVLELLDGSSAAGCWARPHGARLPDEVPSVLFCHQQAKAITCFSPAGIPAVLKCGAFIDAEMRARFGDGEVAVRHEHVQSSYLDLPQALDTPPVCYMNERALRTIGADEEDRRYEFQHVAGLIREERVVVRIVSVERERLVPCGGFSLLRFAEAHPVVCVPTATATLILEGEHAAVYEKFVDKLAALALSPGASTDRIVGLAGGLDAVLRPRLEDVLELVREAME